MKRLNNYDIPDLECEMCKTKVIPQYYFIDINGITKYHYFHECRWSPTKEELDELE